MDAEAAAEAPDRIEYVCKAGVGFQKLTELVDDYDEVRQGLRDDLRGLPQPGPVGVIFADRAQLPCVTEHALGVAPALRPGRP